VELAQPAPEFLAHLGVECAEGFVEQQHFRADRERAGEGDALPLAAGKLGGAAVFKAFEFHQLEQFQRPVADFLSEGRRDEGWTVRPKPMFSATVMWRNRA
jgi:hypothetical protein